MKFTKMYHLVQQPDKKIVNTPILAIGVFLPVSVYIINIKNIV